MLGSRVDTNVGPQIERLLQHGRQESVVDRQWDLGGVGDLCDGPNVIQR